ncbi:MAG: site-2 protease family protein [Pseudomonadota bacterium]|nr:site-2 protease family protein [Pseudomonadota bacterium]
MDIANIIQTIAIYALPVLFAITVHEAAHGYVARYFGDPTAAMLGRITLNPVKHIDPLGTIAMPLFLYMATSGAFVFGYAKPVPVNFSRLRHPRRDSLWVALAGPASNLVQALGWGALLYLLSGLGVQERFFIEMCNAGVLVNVIMFVFNLFPLPPLDGGRIVTSLLPTRLAIPFSRIEPWGFFIVMALVVAGVVSQLWMLPLMKLTFNFLNVLLSPLTALLH